MADFSETNSVARLRTLTRIGLASAAGLLVAGVTAAPVLAASPHVPVGAVLMHVTGVAMPIALGLFCLSRGEDARMSVLFVAAGLLWSLVTLDESGNSVLYSSGRLAVWLVEPLLVYLILVFPFGDLRGRAERGLLSATLLLVGVLYLPTVLVAQYPTPAPWSTCGTHCPKNAFAIGDSNSVFVHDFARPLREVLTVVIWAAVVAVVARRARRGTPLLQWTLAPVVIIAGCRALTMGVYLFTRAHGGTSALADALGWVYAYSLPALTLAFAAGLLGERLFAANALERLAVRLSHSTATAELPGALADALDDRSLSVAFWVQDGTGRWVDANGWPVKPPEAGEGQTVTEVRSDGRLLAAIVHDTVLSMDPMLLDAAASYALTAVENERLVGRLESSLRELSASRVRLVSVADRERRKIERDLHDGAQQRLVALRIKLELLADKLEQESPRGAAAVRSLEDDVEATIDEVRSFARGVYPSLLAERGLSEALRAAGRGSPLPTMVDAAGLGRYPPEVESTVYFACIEALQNAVKHAVGARAVMIRIRANGHLEFEVRDDGEGFDAKGAPFGGGLTNLRDRLAAVGGRLTVESAPGRGTRVAGVIPVG